MNWVSEIINQLSKIIQWWIIVLPWQEGVRIRFGKKVKILKNGIHFRIPFFDECKVNSVRLHFVTIAPQTLTTLSGETITVSMQVGYSITDIFKIYNKVSGIEEALHGVIGGCVSVVINNRRLEEIDKGIIESSVKDKILALDWGLDVSQVNVITYAVVKTFRLIKDDHWVGKGMEL